MRFFTAIFAAIAIAAPVFGIPIATVPLHEYNGEIRSGRYIVNVKDGVARSTVAGTLKNAATHDWDIANAFAAELDDATLNELRVSPHVEYIEEEGAQTNAPWGLSRLSSSSELSNQDTRAFTDSYTYDAAASAS